MFREVNAVTPVSFLQGQSFGKFFAGFCPEAGFIDFEDLADQGDGSSSTGFGIA
jgi:hypothetical protein